MIAWRHGMVGEVPGQGDPLIPQPSLTLPALRQAVAAVAPGRLPEMFAKMQDAFVRAVARRLHEAERTLMSDDVQVRETAIREAGEIVRDAHRAVAGE
jgi:HPt (histidine-containing phosphotransfer) domain-containing protein